MDDFSGKEDKELRSKSSVYTDDDNNQTENISSSSSIPPMISPFQTFDIESYNTTPTHSLMVSPFQAIIDETYTNTTLPPPTVSPLQTVADETYNTTIPPPLMVSPLQTIVDETYNTTTPPLIMVSPLRTTDDETHTTTPPPTLEVAPLGTVDDEIHRTTTTPPTLDVPMLRTIDDMTNNTTAPPLLEVTLPRTVTGETNNTATPHPSLVSPLQTIIPFGDANKDYIAADVGPSTGPIKRKRGRPKGSKNLKMSLGTVDDEIHSTTTIPPTQDVPMLRTIDDMTDNTTAPPPLEVTPPRTTDDETHTTTPHPTLEVAPLGTVDDEIHRTTTTSPTLDVAMLRTIDDMTNNTTSPPLLEVTLPRTVTEETKNTATPHLSLVSPLQTIIPFDDANKDYIAADVGPSTGPIKRKRGRPKGSKNLKMSLGTVDAEIHSTTTTPTQDVPMHRTTDDETHTTTPLPTLEVAPLGTVDDEVHSTTTTPPTLDVPMLQTIDDMTNNTTAPPPLEVTLSRTDNDETSNTETPLPSLVSPLQTIIPFDDANKDNIAADVGPSTGPIKRKRGRPKGSKNLKMSTKKPKTYDPNSKVVTSCPAFDSLISEAERETGNQEVADSVLMRFDAVRRRLCQLSAKGVLTTALTNCKNLGVSTNTKKRIGPVPGVQIGDIFYFWGEMCLVGLHTQMVAGIDYLTVKDGATEGPLATSVVSSGHYDDETEDLETLIYTGHGGTDKNGQAIDQKLGRGNLALQTSKDKMNEVRVIRGKEDPNNKNKKIYIYDGLYLVVDYWKVKGKSGFEEFKFKLVRKPDQPSGYANWKLTENWRKCGLDDSRKGLILKDISYGVETLPVPLVNEIDENDKDQPQDFSYNRSSTCSSMTAVVKYQSTACRNCQNQLCEDTKCPCVQRNDNELPYHNRLLVCRKPMVYECGDMCPCPPDCHNRVTQTGLKIRVEVFKTENCGWGLRSWEPIRAGTFICELVGMNKRRHDLKTDDEYVFDTSRIYNRFKWNYEPELVGEDCWDQVSEVFKLRWQMLINAKEYGNVSRFMNHSCSPNVMWQPIEFEDDRQPFVRIAFFAIKHIPPLTELRYDYGISCDTVEVGEDGTKIFKGKKICYCGSAKCRGYFG